MSNCALPVKVHYHLYEVLTEILAEAFYSSDETTFKLFFFLINLVPVWSNHIKNGVETQNSLAYLCIGRGIVYIQGSLV